MDFEPPVIGVRFHFVASPQEFRSQESEFRIDFQQLTHDLASPCRVSEMGDTQIFRKHGISSWCADSDSCILAPDFCAISTKLNRTRRRVAGVPVDCVRKRLRRRRPRNAAGMCQARFRGNPLAPPEVRRSEKTIRPGTGAIEEPRGGAEVAEGDECGLQSRKRQDGMLTPPVSAPSASPRCNLDWKVRSRLLKRAFCGGAPPRLPEARSSAARRDGVAPPLRHGCSP